MLRKIKLNLLINMIGRNIFKVLNKLSQSINQAVSRWDISGKVKLNLHGKSFYMFSKCDDQIVHRLYYGLAWEDSELKVWSILSEKANTILDIGANTGVFTIVSNKINPETTVYSFEPNPVNFKRLSYNLSINNLDCNRLIRKAVGDCEDVITFTVPKNEEVSLVSSAVGEFSSSFFDIEYKKIAVEQTSLDTFITETDIDHVDLIKIDVEYYEEFVLKGAKKLLAEHSPVIMCEIFLYEVLAGDKPDSPLVNSISKDQADNIEKLMKEYGYNIFLIGSKGLLHVQDLKSTPDGGRNYLFSKVKPAHKYLPYTNKSEILNILKS